MSAVLAPVDERNISRPIHWVKQQRANAVVEAMKRRHFQAQYVPDREAALAAVMALVPAGASVFRSDSVTLDQMGVIPALRARATNPVTYPQEKDGQGNNIHGDYDHNKELYFKLQREVFLADVYITGANAVTLDGKIVSTDGAGNRVAAMIFGPRKVVIVVGVNKIVKDVDAAFDRIHEYCAPVNVKRHLDMHNRPWYGELPCASTGICTDCDHPRRICNYTGILEGALPRMADRINVVLVGEELGL
jgi:hypothetical protein